MTDSWAPFTGFGDDTNSSIKFTMLAPGGRVGLWEVPPRGADLEVPHSNRTIEQSGGLGLWTATFRVELDTPDDLVMLQTLQRQRATLRYRHRITNNPGGIITTLQGVSYVVLPETTLKRVSNPVYEQGSGVCEADLTFTRPAASSAWYGFAVYGEDE